MNIKSLIASLALAFPLAGCAGFQFYSDPALTTKAAIPIAQPKPYLLVVRTGAKEKPLEASIIYLSDYTQAIYARPRSGFGSSNLSLSLSNGQLTAFGQQTDTKLPELVTSLSGLITARGTAEKASAEADQILASLQSAELATKVGQAAQSVAADIRAKTTEGTLSPLSQSQKASLASIEAALSAAANILNDPAQAPQHEAQVAIVKAQATELSKFPTATASTPLDSALRIIALWKSQLDTATKAPAQPKPSFELYEIEITSAGTTLKLVEPPSASTGQ